jgi:pimeloyl-ACP methyl ester carboxylesterase
MRERGYFAAAVSLPGYGTTSGPPDFWGPRSQAALRAALDHLLALPNIDREKVAVYGVSGGAATASMVATSDPRITALILVAGVYDLGIEYPSGDPGSTPISSVRRARLQRHSQRALPCVTLNGFGRIRSSCMEREMCAAAKSIKLGSWRTALAPTARPFGCAFMRTRPTASRLRLNGRRLILF